MLTAIDEDAEGRSGLRRLFEATFALWPL